MSFRRSRAGTKKTTFEVVGKSFLKFKINSQFRMLIRYFLKKLPRGNHIKNKSVFQIRRPTHT